MKRTSDIDALYKALTLISEECATHKFCRKCRLYFNNDCALNRPPAHFEIGEIIMHLHPANIKAPADNTDKKYDLKE